MRSRAGRVRSKHAHGSRRAGVPRGRMAHLGGRHGRDVPHVAAARPRGRAARGRGGADQGGIRPAQGDGGTAAHRPRAPRFPDPQHLGDPGSGRRGAAPGPQARRGRPAGAAGDPGGGRGRRTGTARDARRAAQRAGRRQQRPQPAGQPRGTRTGGRAARNRARDRRETATPARSGPGRLPDRAGSADQRKPSRRPGLRLGSPGLHAGNPLGPGRQRRPGHRDQRRQPPAALGLGLVGMRERVSALGGRLQAGPRDGGGFLVRAELPARAPS